LNLVVRRFESSLPQSQQIEVVERKGIGHPDTICDGLAEKICVCLCRYYLDRFGVILHHNVDKVLLCAGAARVSFGGGTISHPIEIYVGGRATGEYRGERIPVHEIAEKACQDWFAEHLPTSPIGQHVRIIPRIRPGSGELVRLFAAPGTELSNDTSCGAGFAPLTDLENVVLEVERRLNSAETKHLHPAIGVDTKVMGLRQGSHINLTISCALVDRHISNVDDYLQQKANIRRLALDTAQGMTKLPVEAAVNVADDVENQAFFLTVLGTSAEAGDDGEAGRGNRTCGLITPYRPMTLESAAGKNPATHVGKLYNLLAGRIARTIVAEVDDVTDAQTVLVSQIGRPVADPQIVDLCLADAAGVSPAARERDLTEIVHAEFDRIGELRNDLLAERVRLY
jgi:S-adenosylmethionine synthetase